MRMWRRLRTAIKRPAYAAGVGIHHALIAPSVCKLLDAVGGEKLIADLAVRTIDADAERTDRPAILVLDRLFFSKDVDELRRRGQRFEYVALDTHILSVVQALWLPEELQEQISYAPRTRAEHAPAWARAERFSAALLAAARRRWNVVGVLCSNVDYWQHEAMRRVCRAQNVPFLVLCQELQTVPCTYDASIKLYTDADFRFSGTAVAVFGERTRDMLVESRCNTADEVWVTGAPRLDPWLLGEIDLSAPADTITLLAYDGDQYFAPKNYRETLQVFAEASARHRASGLNFVLKCKDAEDEVRARGYLASVEHNLEITNVRSLFDLLPRSRMVIGYNSLALIEALFGQAELVVPQWSDAARPPDEQNIVPANPQHHKHFRFIESPGALRMALDEAVATPRPLADLEDRARVVGSFFYLPESSATAETENFIAHYVARAATPPHAAAVRSNEVLSAAE
jgi:hypothetical protein